jgi:hypothetical protein
MSAPLGIPPAAERRRIVSELDSQLSVIDELVRQHYGNLEKANRLQQAILSRAYSGECC